MLVNQNYKIIFSMKQHESLTKLFNFSCRKMHTLPFPTPFSFASWLYPFSTYLIHPLAFN